LREELKLFAAIAYEGLIIGLVGMSFITIFALIMGWFG
jgi:hypothetical protein